MGAPPASDATKTKKRILVVEDDADVVRLLQKVLSLDFEVTTASDGMEGLSAATANPPDLIIADVMMPRLDGVSMIGRLRQVMQARAVPVIFLTAKSGPKDVIAGIAVGARHYLTKPFKVDELLGKVRKALGQK